MAFAGVSVSRANLCEILAMKLLAPFAASKVELVAVLMTSWSPLAGASREVVEEVRVMMGGEDDDVVQDPQCVLEMAIATKAKSFLSAPLVQTVITDIYRGRVVFSMASHKSLLADNYKPRAIEMYDPRKGPFLDHYRYDPPLAATLYDSILAMVSDYEYPDTEQYSSSSTLRCFFSPLCSVYRASCRFVLISVITSPIFLSFADADRTQVQTSEIMFIVFAVSFILEEYGVQKEHGWAGWSHVLGPTLLSHAKRFKTVVYIANVRGRKSSTGVSYIADLYARCGMYSIHHLSSSSWDTLVAGLMAL